MRKFLLFLMMLAFVLPAAIAGEKTVTISRNEGIYDDGTGVYYCTKGGITMTFSSGLNNVNYLVEHQQVVFDIFSTNYVIKKIKFNCLDNTTNDNLDCFYWGPSTIHECERSPYVPTGHYNWDGYIGIWTGGTTPSKYVKFETEGKPVRFGSVEITYDKEYGDIYEKVTDNSEIENGQTYALVSQYASKALGKEDYYGSDNLLCFTSTPVTLLDNNNKVKVTDEVQLIKLESTGNSNRPWYLKVGDNYIRRRSSLSGSSSGAANGQGYNLTSASTVTSYEQYFRVSISVSGNTNRNALIRFEHNSSETTPPDGSTTNKTFAIRHYNGGSLFRDMDYSTNNQYASNQRVYLYKPAQSYEVTTECIPTNGGYITLDGGILTDDQGRNWSQHFDNVTFFVGPTEGWGVGEVTLTDINSKAVTTLQPTNTSDFGNNYSFEMPANNVHITANFLQPYRIDTICNPTDGGVFNFISGSTDFNGEHKSNEGKTVTFKPIAADGYTFTSVTYYDGQTTTTLTPDANGVYSFVMPGNDVLLTANFEEANDLYLLGTANGETVWHPYGPKFTFDGENQVYYIDVYFKGDSLYNNGAGDPYGHFSLSRMISTNPNEGAGWGEISGHRIFATSPDYWVQDGGTYNNCFQTYTDQAFKIPAGVYRITVSKDLDQMTISEYKPTLVFTPAGGTLNDPTLVDLNTEVVITSNLEQLVHDINPNEPSHATFYNTTDGWATNEHDNTRVISDYDVTTITANVNLGYIKKEGNASYEVISDLYLLGTANGMNSWQPYGPQFTYDANTETYSLDVYFTGLNVNAADEGFGYFSLTKVISNPQQPNWSDIPNSARINAQYNDFPITGLAYNQSTDADLYQTDPNWCFKIDPGIYTITVNKDKTEMTVTKHELTLTFNPVSGTTVAAGDNVNISSNLEQVVHAINPAEPLHATIMYATSTDGSLLTPNTEGSTVAITAVDATTTVNAEAKLGYITVTGNANYIIPAPTVYSITTIVTPEGAGTITAPAGATAGTTVTFTVNTNDGYRLDQVQVTYGYSQVILEDVTYDPETGVYSFVMPDDEVKIYADYTQSHDITTVVNPDGAGTITVAEDAFAGETVTFTVTPNDGYAFNGDVTVTYTDGSTGTITVTDNGDGTYNFTMPDKGVTINAGFDELAHSITTVCDPVQGGTITLAGDAADGDEMAGQTVNFTVEANTGFSLNTVTVTYDDGSTQTVDVTDNGDGTYSFVMPAEDVIVTANFDLKGEIFRLVTKTSEIVEGKTYIYVSQPYDKVMAYAGFNELYGDADIIEWVTPDKWKVKVDGRACFFKPFMLADTLNVYKAAYLQALDGCFLGYDMGSSRIRAYGGLPNSTNHISNDLVRLWMSITSNYVPGTGVQEEYIFLYSSYLISGRRLTYDGTFSYLLDDVGYNNYVNLYKLSESYNIFTDCTPAGSGELVLSGDVTGTTAFDGDTVTVTPIPGSGYAFDDVTGITVTVNDTGETVEVINNGDGTYSFVMPIGDVTVSAAFLTGYTITTICDPADGGQFGGILYPTAYEGQRIEFTVTPNDNYVLDYVTFVFEDSETEESGDNYVISAPEDGNRTITYAFEMPAEDVTIIAHFKSAHHVTHVVVPTDDAGSIVTGKVLGTWYIEDNYFAYGDYVLLDVYQNGGYLLDSVKVTRDDNGQPVTLVNPAHEEDGYAAAYYWDFDMPDADVTVTAYFSPYTPLGYIEDFDEKVESGDRVVVSDSLLVVWVAKDFLWAKDLAKSNDYVEQPEGTYDYVKLNMDGHQTHKWDQSNWVKLDGSELYPDMDVIARRKKLEEFVDHKIVPGTVKGVYTCDTYSEYPQIITYFNKVNHTILLSEPPVAVPYPNNHVTANSFGYPGYMQDPKELIPEYDYSYNHYIPTNFITNFLDPEGGCVFTSGDKALSFLDAPVDFFFMTPKDQEVAQVWAVYYGYSEDYHADLFTMYEYYRQDGITQNSYDLPGNFSVLDGNWCYNRLRPEWGDNVYDKPGSLDGGVGALKPDTAYLFHVAIRRVFEYEIQPRGERPDTGSDTFLNSEYIVYPLDVDSHQGTVTAVHEMMAPGSNEIAGITYYNMMGQESSKPFDGINIRVIRYKDGSFSSSKILMR